MVLGRPLALAERGVRHATIEVGQHGVGIATDRLVVVLDRPLALAERGV
jgi:hypothetical protein